MSRSAKMPLYAAAILALSVVPSAAYTVTSLGPLVGLGHVSFGNPMVVGSFQDYYTFSVPGAAGLSNSITNSYVISGQDIIGLKLSLYEGTFNGTKPNGGGVFLENGTTTNPGGKAGVTQAILTTSTTDPGNYYFEVSASPGSKASAAYNGNLAYATTPLPSGLPMLSGAILALAATGHVVSRRRKQAGASA